MKGDYFFVEKYMILSPVGMAAAGLLLSGISLTDISAGIIPDSLILTGILGYTITIIANYGDISVIIYVLLRGMIAVIPVLGLTLLMDRYLNHHSMGGGDLKLIFMLGMTTSPVLSLTALTVASFAALGIWFLTGAQRDKKIPFGPALCFGWTVSWHIRCFFSVYFS